MERILFVALLGLLGYLIYLIFLPFLVPLAWAAVFAIMFYPVHRRIRDRLRRPSRAALLSTVLLALLIVGPGVFILGAFANQAVETAQWVKTQWAEGKLPFQQALHMVPTERVLDWFAEHNITADDMENFVTEKLERIARFMATQAGRLARNLVFLLFDLFVTLFATFYLLRDGAGLMERLRRVLPLEETMREHLIRTAHNVLYASVFSGMVVAAVQGLIGGLLFWALGLGAPVLWGMVMGFLSLLPVVGPWLVWVPAALYLVAQGAYGKAIILAAVGGLVVGMADNVLRPILLSGRAQMSGLLVLISILGGVAAFGLLGIVLGPILVALGDAVLEAHTAEPVPAAPSAAAP